MKIANVSTTADAPSEDAPRWRQSVAESSYPGFCKTVLNDLIDLIEDRGWSSAETARQIKHGPNQKSLASSSLSLLLNGKYPADPIALCRAVEKTVSRHRARELFGESGFVETRLYTDISDLADVAVITRRIACLHGGLLCGKTTNALALASRYDRASVVFMTAPYADSYGGFVRRLATVRGIDPRGNLSEVRERTLATFDDSHLLVVDEFHQPLVTYSYTQGLRVYEYLREINDLRRCAILLVGATVGHATLTSDENFARISASMSSLDCTGDRAIGAVGETGNRDLAAILSSFQLAPRPERIEMLRGIVCDHSLARAFDVLRLASGRASGRSERLSWDHVVATANPTLKLAA